MIVEEFQSIAIALMSFWETVILEINKKFIDQSKHLAPFSPHCIYKTELLSDLEDVILVKIE